MSVDDRLQQMFERLGLSSSDDCAPPQRPERPPRASFRLNSSDVEFLRSLGIDPSRTGRSKR